MTLAKVDPASTIDLESGAETERPPAAQPGPEVRFVIHDDYCAIHDEYGTCTCGAVLAVDRQADDVL